MSVSLQPAGSHRPGLGMEAKTVWWEHVLYCSCCYESCTSVAEKEWEGKLHNNVKQHLITKLTFVVTQQLTWKVNVPKHPRPFTVNCKAKNRIGFGGNDANVALI